MGINPDTGEDEERRADDDAPFTALAFKIMTDPYVGALTFLRVYSGVHELRLVRLQLGQGQEGARRPPPQDARQQARGDQGGLRRRHRRRGRPARHHDGRHALRREQARSSSSAWSSRIRSSPSPSSRRRRPIRRSSAARCSGSPPRIRRSASTTNPETGQTLISGMGELHLEIIVDRLLREFKVDANVGKPQVAYKETVRKDGRARDAVHPADRRPRTVRPRRAQARAGEAGRGLLVRRRHQGRRHPARVHSGDREGREGGDGVRRARRLPGRRREGHGHLRLVPRGRLVGDGVQDRRLHGLQGGDGEGVAR